MKRHFAAILLLCGTLLTAGCVTSQPTTLEGMRDLESRKLALRCYNKHEGERLVFGAMNTFNACSRWAQRVMQVRYPKTALVNNYQSVPR